MSCQVKKPTPVALTQFKLNSVNCTLGSILHIFLVQAEVCAAFCFEAIENKKVQWMDRLKGEEMSNKKEERKFGVDGDD